MYTTNCPNCNSEVSNQQPFCPRCGMALTGNAPVGQPQNYPGQTGNQMQYAPAGQPGMPQAGAPGMPQAGPPGMPQAGPPGMPQAGAPGMPQAGPSGMAQAGQPGMAPTAVGGAENNNPGAGKLNMILIGIVGIIALVALVIAVIGILPGKAEEVEDEEDAITIEDFSVENFVLTSEIHEFEYIENSIAWDGAGEITVSDNKNVFFVAFKKTLVSGGNDTSTKEAYQIIIVEDGSGTFTTYAYGDVSVTSEPKYEFEILGFSQLSK